MNFPARHQGLVARDQAEIPDAEEDFLRQHFEQLTKIHPHVNEDETRQHPIIEDPAVFIGHASVGDSALGLARGVMVALSATIAAVAVLLAGMVVGHLFLLPDATVWPLGVASILAAALSFVMLVTLFKESSHG